MSIHPSLRSSSSKKHKSVLTRLEKILRLQKEEKWHEGDSVLGLPKVKVTRLKIKKEKVKAAETAEAAAAAAPEAAAGTKPAPGAKPAAETKPTPGAKAAPSAPAAKQESAKKPPEKK